MTVQDILHDPDYDKFDEFMYEGPKPDHPLKVVVRRFIKRRLAVIEWEVMDAPGWQHTYVIGRQYTNGVPTSTIDKSEPANRSERIEGSRAKRGIKHIEIEARKTAHFGFWIRTRRVEIIKKFVVRGGGPDWVKKRPKHPLTFSIHMPERADSRGRLGDRREEEILKEQIRNILRRQQPKPTVDPKEQAKQEVTRTLLKNKGLLEAAEEEVRNFSKYVKQIEEAIEQDLIKPDFGQHLINKMEGELEKFLEETERRLTGEPLA